MDWSLLLWVFSGVLSVMGYLMKKTLETSEADIKSLKSELEQIKRDYLLKEDFKEFKAELRGMFVDLKQDIREIKQHYEKD